jgi:hypothetical protein
MKVGDRVITPLGLTGRVIEFPENRRYEMATVQFDPGQNNVLLDIGTYPRYLLEIVKEDTDAE